VNGKSDDPPRYKFYISIGNIDPEKPKRLGILHEKLTAFSSKGSSEAVMYGIEYPPESDKSIIKTEPLQQTKNSLFHSFINDIKGEHLLLKHASTEDLSFLQPIYGYLSSICRPVFPESRQTSFA
jgi:hypothetical protein